MTSDPRDLDCRHYVSLLSLPHRPVAPIGIRTVGIYSTILRRQGDAEEI